MEVREKRDRKWSEVRERRVDMNWIAKGRFC